MSNAHIANIAMTVGGQAYLDAMGTEPGMDKVREAISSFAQDGGAAYVDETIIALFGNDDSALTDEQVAELGAALVENYQP